MLTRAHGSRARLAADRNEALIVERVVRQLVLADVAPHFAERPGRERVPLHDRPVRTHARGVALHDFDVRARRALIAALPRHPGAAIAERSRERTHLAHVAALTVPVVVK